MSAEFAKLRYLAFPKWTAVAVLAAAVVVGVALLVFSPSDPKWYETTPAIVLTLVLPLAGITLGAWIATLEFASGTMQRTLTAEPDRHRVLWSKLLVVLIAMALIALAAVAAGFGLADFAAHRASVAIDDADLGRHLFSEVPQALSATALGFAVGLLTRSIGGGIAGGFALSFVLDGALRAIPAVGDYTYGQLSGDLAGAISGGTETINGPAIALVGTIAWVVVLLLPGWIRFARGDLR